MSDQETPINPCRYGVWDSTAGGMNRCGEPGESYCHGKTYTDLCPMHLSFVADAESPAVQTSAGPMAYRSIKEHFKANRPPRKAKPNTRTDTTQALRDEISRLQAENTKLRVTVRLLEQYVPLITA